MGVVAPRAPLAKIFRTHHWTSPVEIVLIALHGAIIMRYAVALLYSKPSFLKNMPEKSRDQRARDFFIRNFHRHLVVTAS